ncbi:hypothetical protein BU17DRAFT_81170 [Hysterangium stoloniferum]|nr:hypothetical protein BU17DRAFT_81170 [Hysterangium stoloniferum]
MPQSPAYPSSKRTLSAHSLSTTAAKKSHKRQRQTSTVNYSMEVADSSTNTYGLPSSTAPLALNLPSSSSAFFPPGHSSMSYTPPTATSETIAHPSLDDLHREAFTSLRQSVTTTGEGFVRRMREWEQNRHMKSSKLTLIGSYDSGNSKRRTVKRDLRRNTGSSTVHGDEYPVHRQANTTMSCGSKRPVLSLTEDGDTDEDIMLIDDEADLLSLPRQEYPHSIPTRYYPIHAVYSGSASLDSDVGNPMYSQHTATMGSSPHYIAARMSSSFSLSYTSDDGSSSEGHYPPRHLGSSPYSPSKTEHRITVEGPLPGLVVSAQYPQRTEESHSRPNYLSPQLCIISVPDMPAPLPEQCTFETCEESTSAKVGKLHSASDETLAAIIIALSNGSGGLKDYGDILEAQRELEEPQAGALWE